MRMTRGLLFLCLISLTATSDAGELKLAVAANFKATIEKIVAKFEQKTKHKITITSASSGTLFSQISHGAPFDIFLSADSERPIKLVKNNLALADTRFTYAIGQLAFWTPKTQLTSQQSIISYIDSQKGKLAIANPRLAPYGKSAHIFIIKNNLALAVKSTLINGNNVAQAFQFVESGNAQSGIISYAQLRAAGISSDYILLQPTSYPRIKQQAVILKNSKNIALARQLMDFIKTKNHQLIIDAGYLMETNNVD